MREGKVGGGRGRQGEEGGRVKYRERGREQWLIQEI